MALDLLTTVPQIADGGARLPTIRGEIISVLDFHIQPNYQLSMCSSGKKNALGHTNSQKICLPDTSQ